ncbi:MAG: peptidyl-prolyl cis-trans isomerase [Firmicutes bacterium]|nr:peptidyl-prolyl cis-trans isomerase [Bacillota bacterium]
MSPRRNAWGWGGLAVALSSFLAGCGSVPAARPVARVGPLWVTQSDLAAARAIAQIWQGAPLDRAPSVLHAEILAVAEEQAVAHWAFQHRVPGTSRSQALAKQWMARALGKTLGPPAHWAQRLSSLGTSLAAVTRYVQDQYAVEAAYQEVTRHVPKPSPGAESQYYRQHLAYFAGPPEVLLRTITVKKRAEAAAILHALSRGASFSALALRDSQDAYRAQGGSRGWVAWGASPALPPALQAAALTLRPGAPALVSGPFGYAIAEVQAWRPGPTAPFSAVEPAIEAALWQKARDAAFSHWVRQLLAHEPIRVVVSPAAAG